MHTITDCLAENASLFPGKTAFEYVSSAGMPGTEFTFEGLNEMVKTVAAGLQTVARPGDRIALLFPSGIEFVAAFLGTLHAGMVAVPLYLPRKNKMAERVRLVLNDCGSAVLFTNEKSAAYLQKNFDRLTDKTIDPFVTWEFIVSFNSSSYLPVTISGDTLAFLQYTSGSTGNPKGVKVSHHNLLSNLDDLFRTTGQSAETVMVSWLPVFHDLGLITGILLPVYAGFTCHLMSPVNFITQPLSWLKLIADKRATHAVAPNFAFDLCTEAARSQGFQLGDLDCLRYLGNCAEPVRWETVRDFIDLFYAYGLNASVINPGYGLAEATLKVTSVLPGYGIKKLVLDGVQLEANKVVSVSASVPRSKTLISCGKPDHTTSILIIDTASGGICNDFEIGEICIHGPSVTSGYWNDEIKTKNLFIFPGNGKVAYLKTGDAGFINEGELYITSRLKDLLIFNGANHYPQDIEWTVANAGGNIKKDSVAAFSIEVAGEEKLVVVAELNNENEYFPGVQSALFFNGIIEALSENHGLVPHEIVIIRRMTIPKTSSGKIQRSACRQQFLDGGLIILDQYNNGGVSLLPEEPATIFAVDENADPFFSIVKALAERVLKIPQIAADKNLYQLGIDSIRAIQLIHAIEEELAINIPPSLIFEVKNLNELVLRLKELDSLTAGPPVKNNMDNYDPANIDNLTETELDEWLQQIYKQDAYPAKTGIDENE